MDLLYSSGNAVGVNQQLVGSNRLLVHPLS